MKLIFTSLALATIIFSSCTSAYKTGQTPDDVYYSPNRAVEEYVQIEDEEEKYESSDEYYEDRQLRMKVRNRTRWSDLDDWYAYDRRNNYYGNYHPIYNNSPWNSYTYWNYYYNPYCPKVVYGKPNSSTAQYNKPRVFNLNSYTPPTTNTYGGKVSRGSTGSTRPSVDNGNSSSRQNQGSTLRDIFSGSSRNSSSSSSTSTQSSSSSSSSKPSSSSSSSGGSAPVRKF